MHRTVAVHRLLPMSGLALALQISGCDRTLQQPTQSPAATQAASAATPTRLTDRVGTDYFVSFYKLLARPEDYSGKSVSVRGVLSISDRNGSQPHLYPNVESFQNLVITDSILLTLTDEQWRRFLGLNGKHVAIKGTFEKIGDDEYMEAGEMLAATQLIDFSPPDKQSSGAPR